MKNRFLITNGLHTKISDLIPENYQGDNFCFYAADEDVKEKEGTRFFIDGYIMPREQYFEEYRHLSQDELILELFSKYSHDFIQYVKGAFTIVIIHDEKLSVFNDRHAVKKFFCYRKDREMGVSNDIQLLGKIYTLVPDKLFPAIQALFQHHVHELTMFENVSYSSPATDLRIGKDFQLKSYWKPHILLEANRNKYTVEDVVRVFSNTVRNHAAYFSPDNVSITLTGGRDTRSVLSALMHHNIRSHAFTFGFPTGKDVIASKRIAKEINIPFSNHYIESIDDKKYQVLVDEIVKMNDPFIHIHRAHRLDAVKKEKDSQAVIDMLFMGAMGGDYSKGVSFNDYIVTEFMRRYFFDDTEIRELIRQILHKHYVKFDDELIEKLIIIIGELDFMDKSNLKKSEFLMAHSFIGVLHDVQDINVFLNYAEKVVVPFMDIDFFEALFQSPLSLFSNDRSSKNIFKKLQGGELQAHLISRLYPPLARIPLANLYTPKDLLGNRYIYLIKRIYLHFFKVKDTPTFTYNEWFAEFVKNQLNNDKDQLKDFYEMNRMKADLSGMTHQTHEGYWHKYSNPVMLSLYYNQLINKI